MKKLLSFLMLSALVAFASCTKEDVGATGGEEVSARISVALPSQGTQTRAAFANPALTGMRVVLFVSYNDKIVHTETKSHSFGTGATAVNFDLRLVTGKQYKVAVWADFGSSYYTLTNTIGVAPKVEMANTTITGSDNKYDAYFKVDNVTFAAANEVKNFELKRPFGLIKINTTDYNAPAVTHAGLRPQSYSIDAITVPTELNLLTGEAEAPKSVIVGGICSADYDVDADTKELSFDYFFANEARSSLADFSVKYSNASTPEIVTYAYSNIPVRRNWITNIVGNVLTKKGTISVTIAPEWEETELPEGTAVRTMSELTAFMAANNDKTIVLQGDFGAFTVPAGKTFKFVGLGLATVGQVTMTGANVEFDGLTFASNEYGILSWGGSNLTVKNSVFRITPNAANNNTGIMAWSNNGSANGTVVIENNTFNMNKMRGIQIQSCASVTIKGNTFNMNGSTSNYAVQFDSKNTNAVVEGNTINDSRLGVYVHTTTETSVINVKADNVFNNVAFRFAVRPQVIVAGTNTITGSSFGYWLGGATINDATYGLNAVPTNSIVFLASDITTAVTLPKDKNLYFLGPNNGVNPNTETRWAETKILAPFNYTHSEATTGNFVFDGFTFSDKGQVAVGKANGANLMFLNNIVTNTTLTQTFFATPAGYGEYWMGHIVVNNNKVDGAGLTDTNTCGFRIWKVAKATFEGNSFANFSHSAAQFDNVTGQVMLNNNTFSGCANYKFRAQVANIGSIDSGNNEGDLARR